MSDDAVDISRGFARQMQAVVKQQMRTGRDLPELAQVSEGKKPSAFPDHAVILDAALPAATHALAGAASCLATVCQWNTTTGVYKETDLQVRVWNHSESTSHEIDTFGMAKYQNGHYWVLGDCEPMAVRAVPS